MRISPALSGAAAGCAAGGRVAARSSSGCSRRASWPARGEGRGRGLMSPRERTREHGVCKREQNATTTVRRVHPERHTRQPRPVMGRLIPTTGWAPFAWCSYHPRRELPNRASAGRRRGRRGRHRGAEGARGARRGDRVHRPRLGCRSMAPDQALISSWPASPSSNDNMTKRFSIVKKHSRSIHPPA